VLVHPLVLYERSSKKAPTQVKKLLLVARHCVAAAAHVANGDCYDG
jgi:hypothetical protein